MKIVVCGVSAQGCVCAAMLSENGHDVTLICPDVKTLLLFDKQGLDITDFKNKTKTYKLKVAIEADKQEKYDICFVAVSGYKTREVIEEMANYLADDGVIITIQNTITESDILNLVGIERTLSSMMTWEADKLADNHVIVTADGDFYIGRIDGEVTPKVKEVGRVMDVIFPTVITDKIVGHKFSKLIICCAVASVTLLCGLSLYAAVGIKQARKIMIASAKECLQVADGMNIRIENYADRINFYRLLSGNSFLAKFRRFLSIWYTARKFQRVNSTGMVLLNKNEPSNVDYLNGYIVRKGIQHGIPTPVNARIVEMIHETEKKNRTILIENLFDEQFMKLK